ncbi:MAG: NADH-quinone oxidoreductase subunit J [Candidatus Woesearchaeota archaeon]|nr:NADH-quinone oxidoreductase subunit J [Candidatus Woesearchaeota archaeon]
MTDVLTVISSLLCIVGALTSISAKEIMRGMLGLTVFFIGIAGFFGKLGAWYLAAGQLFLFVGGVVTLLVLAFSFTKTPASIIERFGSFAIAGIVTVALLFVLPLASVVYQPLELTDFAPFFFAQYGWVVNMALFLLLSAVIGAQYLLEDYT